MNIKTLIEDIESDVKDVVDTKFEYYNTDKVPSIEDSALTFERDIEKKGKKIETCVLFVDIRNSVALTEKHFTQTMGRIYTALTKGVLKAAHHHGGFVRNIIGDRIMVVFPSKNCFTNAVDCAITINHISKYIIAKQFPKVDFKCGIGIDYGELRVIKVGVTKKGVENKENKGLVWVGYPANLASRLTDVANKTIEEEYYEVTQNPINPRASRFATYAISTILKNPYAYDPNAPAYLFDKVVQIEYSPIEFASKISSTKDGELYISGGKYIRHEKKIKEKEFKPILMTAAVYNGLKSENPEDSSIKNNYFKKINHSIDNIKSDVYEGNVHWVID